MLFSGGGVEVGFKKRNKVISILKGWRFNCIRFLYKFGFELTFLPPPCKPIRKSLSNLQWIFGDGIDHYPVIFSEPNPTNLLKIFGEYLLKTITMMRMPESDYMMAIKPCCLSLLPELSGPGPRFMFSVILLRDIKPVLLWHC